MRTFSCDIETDGIDATVVWCIAVHNIETDQVITFAGDCLNLFKPWLESEADCLIFHNGIAFDVPVLESLLDIDFSGVKIEDTMVMSQLYVKSFMIFLLIQALKLFVLERERIIH